MCLYCVSHPCSHMEGKMVTDRKAILPKMPQRDSSGARRF